MTPNPLSTAVAIMTEYAHTGSSAQATAAPHTVGPKHGHGYALDGDALIGLTTMCSHLLHELADLHGITPEQALHNYALHIATQLSSTEPLN